MFFTGYYTEVKQVNFVIIEFLFKPQSLNAHFTAQSPFLHSSYACAFMEILTNFTDQAWSLLPHETTHSATGSPFLPMWHVEDMSYETRRKDWSTQHPYEMKTGCYRVSRGSAMFQSFSSVGPRLPSCTSFTSQDAALQLSGSFLITLFKIHSFTWYCTLLH